MSSPNLGVRYTSERAEAAAKRLRKQPTLAERLLWAELRRSESVRFRRQAPFGSYVVDFICHAARLVIEVDGGVHHLPEVVARDAERDIWIKSRGYAVLRLTNHEIINDPEQAGRRVLDEVRGRLVTEDLRELTPSGLQLHRRTDDAARHGRELSAGQLRLREATGDRKV